jgi:hypothetical protein
MRSMSQITKAQAIGMLEAQPVYARMTNGDEIRVGAIAWNTFAEYSTTADYATFQVDDVQYFFTKN